MLDFNQLKKCINGTPEKCIAKLIFFNFSLCHKPTMCAFDVLLLYVLFLT